MKTANILDLTSLIYSQMRKTVAPNLLATEIIYLALFSISSSVSPARTNSSSIALGSIEDNTLKKKCPFFKFTSLKEATLFSSGTLALAHSRILSSVKSPRVVKTSYLNNYQSTPKTNFFFPSTKSRPPTLTN